jgi:hypothetical protein
MAGRRRSALLVSSLALALAPKCPLCFLAYAGLVGSASLSWSVYGIYGSWLAPLTAVALALTVVTLASRRAPGPALLALFAAGAIFAGRFWLDRQPFVYSGMAVLLAAAAWGSRPGPVEEKPPCCLSKRG